MKDVFYAMPILFSCLCGCGGYERLWHDGVNLQDYCSSTEYFKGVNDVKNKCSDLIFRAIGEVGETNIVIYVVNNSYSDLAVDVNELRASYLIIFKTDDGLYDFSGEFACGRCGPLEVNILEKPREINGLTFADESAFSFEIPIQASNSQKIDEIILAIPYLELKMMGECKDINELELMFMQNRACTSVKLVR